MRKLIASEWVTLDGVFDADTMPQWFEPYETDARNEYVKETILACDAMLVGRVTYEMLAAYWPNQKNNEFGIADKVNNVRKYVVSSTLKKAEWGPATIIKDNAVQEITKLKQQPGQYILVSGSAALVQTLMRADLIDEYRFLVHPIVMGNGKRWFKDGMAMARLKLAQTKALGLGVTLLCYEPAEH